MHVSTVHPQNDGVITAMAEDGENETIHQHRNTSFITKRCTYIFIPVIIVLLVMISAIVIPLMITSSRNKNASQLTTISTTESEITILIIENDTALETMNITDFNATERTETIRSSTPSNDTAIITTKEKLTSEVSSTSDSKSMERVSTSATSVNSGTFETTSVDSSTKTNSISSSWPNDAMTTIITNTKATSNQPTTASTQSKPTTEPTTPRQLIPLNQVNDTIIGLYNTRAGGSTGGINGTYPPNEAPKYAMDDSPETKYLNFGHKGDPQSLVDEPGIGTGFLVIPSVSNSTLACGLLFTTANDNSYRDPITVTLEGSNATSLTELHLDSSWTLIYNGSTGIDANNSRKTNGTQQNFQNAKRFASYRLLITSKRGVGDAVQYSEARIMGYI